MLLGSRRSPGLSMMTCGDAQNNEGAGRTSSLVSKKVPTMSSTAATTRAPVDAVVTGDSAGSVVIGG